MTGRVLRFPARAVTAEEGRRLAERILSVSIPDRAARAKEFGFDDPETLLALCAELRTRLEVSPAAVRDDADFFFRFLAEPKRPIGLFDEREYFLGEIALLAGSASRMLALREEARRWFDRSEANFRLTVNAVADWSRVTYQRLALRLEERNFAELREHLPILAESFERLDMHEDFLKCRFLEAIAATETGDLDAAVDVYRYIVQEAERLSNERLLAIAQVNLVVVYGTLGYTEEALAQSQKAIPLLERLHDRVNLAKVRQGIGALLRSKHQVLAAIDAYRESQADFAELEMWADVAAVRLIIADLLLETGDESSAVAEILQALPVIEEYKLAPEGVAATALLRESLNQRRVNHQALRDLHGFFEETVS
jgi:tetratricopeptide (TPR) repeat protein